MKAVVWGLVLLLVVLHQDVWNWSNDRLVFGWLPVTLAWHAAISIGASIAWFLAIGFAWPQGLDDEPLSEVADPGNPDSSVVVVQQPLPRIPNTEPPAPDNPNPQQEGGAA